jgi:hypothetical protein
MAESKKSKAPKATETYDAQRYAVREIAKPTNVVMEGQKVHCDHYCKKSNEIMKGEIFEVAPI